VTDLWSATQQYLELTDTAEGSVRSENRAPVCYVSGLSIENTSEKSDQLSQMYNGLKAKSDEKSSIFYQISLGSISTVKIEVLGEVACPSLYSQPSRATVYTALRGAGSLQKTMHFEM
jgi:hypothetical protein